MANPLVGPTTRRSIQARSASEACGDTLADSGSAFLSRASGFEKPAGGARALRPIALAGLLLALLPAPARAVGYGDIDVQPLRTPAGQPSHGYSEFVFEVRNRGSRAHTVELTLPAELHGGPRQSGLRAIRKQTTVGPGETALVALLQPNTPEVPGSGVAVSIDGRKQDSYLSIDPVRGRSPYSGSGSYSRRRYGYAMRSSMASPTGPLLLISKAVNAEAFPSDPLRNLPQGQGQAQLVRAGLPLTTWSSDWLAYSRYDGVLVAPEDLRPGGAADGVIQALWQYVEAGGVLIVLGPGAFPMPGRGVKDTTPVEVMPPPPPVRGGGPGAGGPGIIIRPGGPAEQPEPDEPPVAPIDQAPRPVPASLERYPIGFGVCLVNKAASLARWEPGVGPFLHMQLSQTAQPWQGSQGLLHYNSAFPVVEDFGVPVRGLFGLIVIFGIVIGPVNLALLARSNRRIWMLWTVPAISAGFCLLVLGYMIAAEGWQGHARIAGVTYLDEGSLRATTLGRTAFYSPLTPGDGLRFSDATEVTPQGEEHSAFSNLVSLSWADGGQHLARGWVTARVPAHFAVRKSEAQRRERVTVAREADGALTMVNGLGVDIEKVLVADDNGVLYRAGPVGAGDKATLTKTDHPAVEARAVPRLRRLYAASDWLGDGRGLQAGAHEVLTRRSYFAVVDRSPFLEAPLKGAREKESKSYVFGLMAPP